MRSDNMGNSAGFGSNLTVVGKKLLLIYGIIYVLELLFEHWFALQFVAVLQLYAVQDFNFKIWQLFTHHFIHDPLSPISFLVSCLVFYFFAPPVEHAFGPKRFLTLFYLAAFGGALCGLGFNSLAGFETPFLGMMPSLLALVVVFGFLNPEATILLMFVLPVKAKYLSYGTILITFLTFLAKVNPHGAYHLGGILGGYLYVFGPGNLFNWRGLYLKYLTWQLKKKKSRFKVIQGSKDKDDDRPTYH